MFSSTNVAKSGLPNLILTGKALSISSSVIFASTVDGRIFSGSLPQSCFVAPINSKALQNKKHGRVSQFLVIVI